eukprot:COSAG02_NODE_1006_length_15265_cov_58.666886_2_plen_353_part_00
MPGDPPAPPGFTLAAGHCIGDSTTASTHCLNPPQQLKCARNACTSADECFKKANADCASDETCSAFAYSASNGMYETFSVGLANVVANPEWTAYAKPMLCCQCPDDGAFIKSTAKKVQSFTTGLHHWHTDNQCATNGNPGVGTKKTAILFCAAFDPKSPGCPVLVEAANNAGSLLLAGLIFLGFVYITGGVVFGRRMGRNQQPGLGRFGTLVSPHPHFQRWALLHSLAVDGMHFTKARLGLGNARHYSPIQQANLPSDSSRSKQPNKRTGRRATGKGPAAIAQGAKQSRRQRRSRSGEDPDAVKSSDAETNAATTEQQRAQPAQPAEFTEQRELQEGMHESQAKIKVVGINM